jgi:hypothetical protein
MEITMHLIHTYNELVKRGLAKPITCPFSYSSEYPDVMLTELNSDGKVVFRCIACNTVVRPGINTAQEVLECLNNNGIEVEK